MESLLQFMSNGGAYRISELCNEFMFKHEDVIELIKSGLCDKHTLTMCSVYSLKREYL